MKNIEVVVGAQYGSEAKGHVTTRLLDKRYEQQTRFGKRQPGDHGDPLVNVRVAGPNAGHTAYTQDGARVALRQVPVGVTRPQPVTLVIAPGSEIDPEVLLDEIDLAVTSGWMENKTLHISPDATVIQPYHKDEENAIGLVDKIGSTGKGIGAARADRILRRVARLSDDRVLVDKIRGYRNVYVGNYAYALDDHVVIEGTQGYGLGLHGIHYPQCTSSDCRAIDFMSMAGISPWGVPVKVWAVARMFPIRVAGNSGPMKDETTWKALGLPEEKTTVTQKVRRVGQWDDELVADAVRANGGNGHVNLVLTMADQRWPEVAGASNLVTFYAMLKERAEWHSFVSRVECRSQANVRMVTTGPTTGFML